MPHSGTVVRLLAVCALLSSIPARGLERASPAGLELRVLKVSPPHAVSVELRNSTSQSLRVFSESNRWGAARWRLLRVRGEDVALAYQVPVHAFSRNLPGYDELPAQATWRREFDLDEAAWHTPGPATLMLDPGDLIVVIYDVPVSDEARRLGVWHGAISASMRIIPVTNPQASGHSR
jgi:hypothetical protein